MILPYSDQLLNRIEGAICGPFGPLQPIIRCNFDAAQLVSFSKTYDFELNAEFTNLQAQAIVSDIDNFILKNLIELNTTNIFYGSLDQNKFNDKDILNFSTNKNCALKEVFIDNKYRFIQKSVFNWNILKLHKYEMVIIDEITGDLDVALKVDKSANQTIIKFGFIPSKIKCSNIDVVVMP